MACCPRLLTLAGTDAHISSLVCQRVPWLASSLILQRDVHFAVEAALPSSEDVQQADAPASHHHAAGTWPWLQAAALTPQQSELLLPTFGAFQAVVAAAAAAAEATATDAALAQLLQLIQQQTANTDANNQQHQELQQKHLQLSAQQLIGATVPPVQLLQLLQASCKLQQTPSQLLQLLTHSAVQALPQLAPVQVAEVLTSLATCHSSCRAQVKQLPKRAALNKALSKYLQQKQHAFDAASTVALAAALARDSYTSSTAVSSSSSSSNGSISSSFTVLSMMMMDHVNQMSSQQLSNVLAACAAAQHYNQAVVDAAVQVAVQLLRQQGFRLQEQQQQQQQEADEASRYPQQQQQQQQSSVTLDADTASSQMFADVPYFSQQAQQQQRDGFSPDSLTQLLQACSSLRHHSAELLECAATATLRSLNAMQLQQVVKVVAACAQLNHYNLALFQEACRLAQQAMAEDLVQQKQQQQQASTGNRAGASAGSSKSSSNSLASAVTQLAWSCSVVHHFEPGFFAALAGWAGQLQVQQLSQQQLLQWFQVQFCISDAAVQLPELRSIGLPSQLLLAAHAAWSQALSGQRLTPFHKEVHDALLQAGRRSRLNVAQDGPLVVDVALQRKTNNYRTERVAIQLETPDMFAANPPYAALGPTAARWRALQSRGWQVLSLRYSDWCRLKTPEERARYMWHIRDASALRTPLAPDVVRVGGQQQESSSKPQKSLTQQLWRLLVD